MKLMKKICTAIFSCLFAACLGVGIALNVDGKATANAASATAVEMSVTYATIQNESGTTNRDRYAFVLGNGLTTPNAYELYVYLNGKKVPAYTIAGHNNIYVDYEYCEFGDTDGDSLLIEIPAGTYYQADKYLAQDYAVVAKYRASVSDLGDLNENVTPLGNFTLDVNTVSWALNASNGKAFYFKINDAEAIPHGDWSSTYTYNPVGKPVVLNGETLSQGVGFIQTAWENAGFAYMKLAGDTDAYNASAGDTLKINGYFRNSSSGKMFYVEECNFVFDGEKNYWVEVNDTDDAFEFKPTTVTDDHPWGGIYASMALNDVPVGLESNGWQYQLRPAYDGKILKNGTPIDSCITKFTANDWYIHANPSNDESTKAKAGDIITVGGTFVNEGINATIKIKTISYQFDGTTWTVVSPTIDVTNNGEKVTDDVINVFPGDDLSTVVASSTAGEVTATYEEGALVDNKFVLRAGESKSEYKVTYSVDYYGATFTEIKTVCVGYHGFAMEEGAAVRVLNETNANGLRFTAEMPQETYDKFIAQDENASFGMIIVPKDYVTPNYELTVENLFGANAKFAENVASGKNGTQRLMLKLNSKPANSDEDGNLEIRGAITDLLTSNITREFVGVAYACVNGTYILADYYEDSQDNNTRSMYYVSQRAIEKGDKYASAVQTAYIDKFNGYLSDAGKTYSRSYTVKYINAKTGEEIVASETVKTSALNAPVTVMAKEIAGYTLVSDRTVTQKLYANKANVFTFTYKATPAPALDRVAWYHPQLDFTNYYNNTNNDAIAQDIKNAGFTTVNLATAQDPSITNEENIKTLKYIVEMFARNGLKSVIFMSKDYTSVELLNDRQAVLKELSNCEGFAGFFAWDEPNFTQIDEIVKYAEWYNDCYGEDETVAFIVNLLPSYANLFKSGTDEYNADKTTQEKSYKNYLQYYCEKVLSLIDGDKILSVDTYPIYGNGTLQAEFIYDLAILKAVALANSTEDEKIIAHAILQACGWDENKDGEYGNDTKSVAPTEAQFRMQAYTALAFGMDSLAWWGYTTAINRTEDEIKENGGILNEEVAVSYDGKTKNGTIYEDLKTVNTELAEISSLYKAYEWKGVIMSTPYYKKSFVSEIKDPHYDAYTKLNDDTDFKDKYILTASDTTSFASISDATSMDTNYIIGVMQDESGNEAFVVVNYGDKDAKSVTITFTANGEDKSFVCYGGASQKSLKATSSGGTLTLAPGEAVFMVSSDAKYTVTFKDDNGTEIKTVTNVDVGEDFSDYDPTANGDYEKPGYVFAGWTPNPIISGNTTLTATWKRAYTVNFVNADGISSQTVAEGDVMSAPATPTLDGYVFNGWQKDGVAYNVSAPVYENTTLTASWLKIDNNGEKSVILTAEQVSQQTMLDEQFNSVSYAHEAGWDWYYDTDYLFVESHPTIDENRLWDRAFFETHGTTASAGAHTIVLPKVNYALYSKVDFGYVISASNGIGEVSINGVAGAGYDNRLVSIQVANDGKYYATVYHVNETTVYVKTELSQAVVNGEEGLTISFELPTETYAWIKVTKFHGTSRVCNYKAVMQSTLAQLPANAEDLTFSAEESALVEQYLQAESYMTAYEQSAYTRPAVISAALLRTVTIVDGAEATHTYQVTVGENVMGLDVPTKDGFVFKGYLKDGVAYDPATPIYEDITLTIVWAIIDNNGVKSVMSAEDVLANSQVEAGYVSKFEVKDNENAGWFFDTDYLWTGSAQGVDENKFMRMASFGVTVDGSNGTSETGVARYFYLPAINYALYSKVDFAFTYNHSNITSMSINGINIDAYKGNKLVCIHTDETGTYLIFGEINGNFTKESDYHFKVKLSDEIATGQVGIRIDLSVKAWTGFAITEFHLTSRTSDYNGEEYTVTFVDGTGAEHTQNVMAGATVGMPATPALDGYTFKAWTYKGDVYDFGTAVTEDITLVATYYKASDSYEKSVILTAEQVSQQTTLDEVFKDISVAHEAGWDWYYDTDYLFVESHPEIDENRLWDRVQFTANPAAAGTYTVVLPKVNYALYSKVDFGYVIAASNGVGEVSINGVAGAGYDYRLVNIQLASDGKYYATVYKVNETTVYVKTELSQAVVNGEEGLTISFELPVDTYAWIKVTKFHGTSRVCDYNAEMASILEQLPQVVEELTGSDAENALVEKYVQMASYMTAYEKARYEEPAVIVAAKDNLYASAVVNATGSEAIAAAAETYRKFTATLSDEMKNSLLHKANAAKVNAILVENFYETTETKHAETVSLLDADGAWRGEKNIALNGSSQFKDTTKYDYETFSYINGNYENIKFTLLPFNFNAYHEAHFGISFAMTYSEGGSITIAGETFEITKLGGYFYRMKAIVKDGYLTLVEDGSQEANMAVYPYYLQVKLSDAVLNGTEGLVVEFNTGAAYGWYEIAELHTVSLVMGEATEIANGPTNWSANGGQAGNFVTSYNGAKQKTFDTNFNGSATLPVLNYNAYGEVYFGIAAIAGARSWSPYDADNGVITINGVSFDNINPNNGWYYFKATVKNSVLTLVIEKADNVTAGTVALTVTLPENVLNGTVGLEIGFAFGDAWSQAEITEVYARNYATKNVPTASVQNVASINGMGGERNIAISGNGNSKFNTENENNPTHYQYETFSYATSSSATNATFTLNAFNYNAYDEVYFGIAHAMTHSEGGSITIAGETFEITKLGGYFYRMKAIVKDGYLTLVEDGSQEANMAVYPYYLQVKLSDAVLNGEEGLVIEFNTGAAYCWLEITNSIAVNGVSLIS